MLLSPRAPNSGGGPWEIEGPPPSSNLEVKNTIKKSEKNEKIMQIKQTQNNKKEKMKMHKVKKRKRELFEVWGERDGHGGGE